MDPMLIIEIAKWSATAIMAISGILVSFSVHLTTRWSTFIGFFLGHVIWSAVAIYLGDWALLAVNAFFIPIDIYAMWLRWSKEIKLVH